MDENIKQLQAVDLAIVKEVIQICDNHNLLYYMIGGTMLGAIRHKGFIPWDDDIDIGMPREDYEKFLEIAPRKFSSHLELVNYKTDPNYQYYITRVRDTTTKLEEIRIGNDSKYTHASIDIFPLDGAPNNVVLRKIYYLRVMFHRAMMSLCYRDSIDEARKRSFKERILLFFLKKIPIHKIFNPIKEKNRIDKLMRKYPIEKSNEIGCLMGAYRTREMVPKVFFGNGEFYKFEDIEMRGPEKYHDFLSLVYGDYMKLPPKESRKTHFKILEINDVKLN